MFGLGVTSFIHNPHLKTANPMRPSGFFNVATEHAPCIEDFSIQNLDFFRECPMNFPLPPLMNKGDPGDPFILLDIGIVGQLTSEKNLGARKIQLLVIISLNEMPVDRMVPPSYKLVYNPI